MPLVRKTRIKANDYIWSWVKSDVSCMVLYGEAGIGKSSFIAKLIDEASGEYEDSKDVKVCAVALRDHCDCFKSLDENYSAKDVLCKLFGVADASSLDNKLLILDGFDELTVLVSGFGISEASEFIHKIILVSQTAFNNIHVLITSREGYFDISSEDKLEIQDEKLMWDRQQVDEWCDLYSAVKKESTSNCRDVKELFSEDSERKRDDRCKILCIPFILYLCCNSDIDIIHSKSICQIYDRAFRGLLMREHSKRLIGSDRLEDNEAEEQKRLVYWQFTKELAYQMFLFDKLDLSNSSDSNDLRVKGLNNAKNRTVAFLKDHYSISIAASDLRPTEYLSVFSFAQGDDNEGISFVHKSVYEYFTAVKLYEDYFSLFSVELFSSENLNQDEVAKSVLLNSIEAFRYKPVPKDIFDYLCEMDKKPFYGKKFDEKSHFDFEGYKSAFFRAMENDMISQIGIEPPVKDYCFIDNNRFGCGSVISQLMRSLHSITWFLTGHGFNNENGEVNSWIRQLLVHADQPINLSGWKLQNAFLEGADFRMAVLDNAVFDHANLVRANFQSTILRKVSFVGSDLRWANLRHIRARRTCFREAILREGDIAGAILYQADMRNAILVNACLMGASLNFADLSNAKMQGALLHSPDLFDGRNQRVIIMMKDRKEVLLKGARLRYAKLNDATFESAQLEYVDFSMAQFNNTHFEKARLEGAAFTNTNIEEAHFSEATYCEVVDGKGTIFPDGFVPEDNGMICVKPIVDKSVE